MDGCLQKACSAADYHSCVVWRASVLQIQVYDMERRQAAAAEREARKAARLALKERQERERNTKLKMEEEAYEMQLQVACLDPCRPS